MASQRLRAREEQGDNVAEIASILYNPEQAAGFTCKDIHELGKKGHSELRKNDVRFCDYKTDRLFSRTKEVDRGSLSRLQVSAIKEEVTEYLRLLPDFLHLPAALETIEYLLRIYKIHIHNLDDLLFCALPYHYKSSFVRFVQLIPIGNSKWGFLSQGQLTRCLIIEKFVEDEKLFKALCEFASSKTSKLFLTFATSIVVGVLTDSTTLYNSLPQIYHGFDLKCALMMITEAADNPFKNNQQQVMNYILKTAQEDPRLLRLSLMTLVNFVQLQSPALIPAHALLRIIDNTELPLVLSNLSQGFCIDSFLELFLESFMEASLYDPKFAEALASIIKTVPVNSLVGGLTSKIFFNCRLQSRKHIGKVLHVMSQIYPAELWATIYCFLEDAEIPSWTGESKLEMLCDVFAFLNLNRNAFKTELFTLLSERALSNGLEQNGLKPKRVLLSDDTFLKCFGMMAEGMSLHSCSKALLFTLFTFLKEIIMKKDTSSIGLTYEEIFNHCIPYLNLEDDEKSVENATIALTKRLSESEFKSGFDMIIGWAHSDMVNRSISFYSLVNRLSETRSISIPCFYQIMHTIIADVNNLPSFSIDKEENKRAKIEHGVNITNWHVKALMISSLKNCFQYDTKRWMLLDEKSSKALVALFQSQLDAEAPSSLENLPDVPSVDKVDDLLIYCISQLAGGIASHYDLGKEELLKHARRGSLRSKIEAHFA